jgi:hypothetical protein
MLLNTPENVRKATDIVKTENPKNGALILLAECVAELAREVGDLQAKMANLQTTLKLQKR